MRENLRCGSRFLCAQSIISMFRPARLTLYVCKAHPARTECARYLMLTYLCNIVITRLAALSVHGNSQSKSAHAGQVFDHAVDSRPQTSFLRCRANETNRSAAWMHTPNLSWAALFAIDNRPGFLASVRCVEHALELTDLMDSLSATSRCDTGSEVRV